MVEGPASYIDWVGVSATDDTVSRLRRHVPEFPVQEDGGGTFIGTTFQTDLADIRSAVRTFIERVNGTLVMLDPSAGPIQENGALVRVWPNGHRAYTMLAEPGEYDLLGSSIVLAARMGAPPGPRRTFDERTRALIDRCEPFRQAAALFAGAGEDFRELYKVAELIERAFGGPLRNERLKQTFFAETMIDRETWEALFRSARTKRHAVAHDDGGRKITGTHARHLLHHALKTWVELKMPS